MNSIKVGSASCRPLTATNFLTKFRWPIFALLRAFAPLRALAIWFSAFPSFASAHHFTFHPPPDVQITSSSRIALTGDFLSWNPAGAPMSPQPDGTFALDYTVPDGRHLYKFTLNGGQRWFHDDQNPAREDDGSGGFNSVLTISGGKAVQTTSTASASATPRPVARGPEPWFADKLDLPLDDRTESGSLPLIQIDGDQIEEDHGAWQAVAFVMGKLVRTCPGDRACFEFSNTFRGSEAQQSEADPNFRTPMKQPGDFLETTGSKGTLAISFDKLALPFLNKADSSTPDGPKPRRLFVYLPPGYTQNPTRRYPVIYLHDGQNVWDDESCCFGHGGWFLNRMMDEKFTSTPAILVGIPCDGPVRIQEYGLGDDIMSLPDRPYLRFLREVVKPRIDKDFRTNPDPAHTTIMGSSMGGVISLYAGYRDSQVWGNVVAMSTAFQVPDAKKKTLLDVLRTRGRGKFRLYLDSGTGGMGNGDGSKLTREFARIAVERGWKPGVDFMHHEEAGAEHNEAAWRARAHLPLSFVLTNSAPKK